MEDMDILSVVSLLTICQDLLVDDTESTYDPETNYLVPSLTKTFGHISRSRTCIEVCCGEETLWCELHINTDNDGFVISVPVPDSTSADTVAPTFTENGCDLPSKVSRVTEHGFDLTSEYMLNSFRIPNGRFIYESLLPILDGSSVYFRRAHLATDQFGCSVLWWDITPLHTYTAKQARKKC
jgi:hypothetical protein